MKLIHISDFHLITPGQPLWGLDGHDRVDRCLEDIARWHGDAEFCVITGDLSDNGEPEAYKWLSDRLQGFPIETILLTGNHDDRAAMIAGFPNHLPDENGFVQSSRRTGEGLFLFLDTLKGEGSAGAYCEQRQAWLRGQLKDAGDDPVWIFMHHPPMDIGITYMDRIKLEDHEAFTEIINGRNIRHIFFGHVHRALFVNWNGIACTSLPGTNHQVPLVRESVDTSYSFEPAMYGVVLIENDSVIVHFDAPLERGSADMPARSP